jgi:hypothetical protein
MFVLWLYRVYVVVCFDSIDYLGQSTVLYKLDRSYDDPTSPLVEYRHHMHEHARPCQHHPRKHLNIVISDMDTVNTCDRPLVKLLRNYCCEWNCQSVVLKQCQVGSLYFRLIANEKRT